MDKHAHDIPLSPEQVFEESDKQLKKDTWLEALKWFEHLVDVGDSSIAPCRLEELFTQIEEKRSEL